jgi:hypothetical protein
LALVVLLELRHQETELVGQILSFPQLHLLAVAAVVRD